MKKFTLVLFTLLTMLSLDAWADETVGDITYSISGSNATVTSVANVAIVTIPATVTISSIEYTVTGIQSGAFNSCTTLEDIAIEGTTFYELSNNAFQNLPTTLAIVFNGIKYKHQGDTWYNGDYFKVLSHTDGVTSYSILESINGVAVTEIADNAFGDISGKSVAISKNITTISNTAFIHFTNGSAQNANNLSDITVAAENTKFFSHNGALYSQEGNEKVLITCPISKSSNTDIWSDGITAIGANAFFCHRSLSSITIPATVKTIEQSAFQYAGLDVASLSVIFSGNQLTTIGTSAFQNSGLTSISLPEGLTKIETSAFNSNAKLTSVSLPASLTTLGTSAFRDCNLLETVTFTEGIVLSAIPSHAFNKCKLTSELIIPEGVTTIGNWAFSNKNSENDGSPATSNLSIVKIPSTISSIAGNAFPAGVTKKNTSLILNSLQGRNGQPTTLLRTWPCRLA